MEEASPLSESSPLSEASIVIDLKASLLRELDTLWGNANEAENFTIFRTPHNISQTKKNLFEPSVISIGPFHRGQKHLRAMEEQKMRFLRDFLFRGDHLSLDLCISEMKLFEGRTRRCYSETFDDLDSNAFVKMMLLDGCFVLEYFSKWYGGGDLYEVGWNSNFINRDLLLQENQIPFFIVDKLYELIGLNQDDRMDFVKYIAYGLLPIGSIIQDPRTETPYTIIANTLAEFPDPPVEIHHLLHLCYHYLVPNPGIPVVLNSKPFDLTRMFSANRIIKGLLHRFRSRVLRGRSPHSTPRSLSVALPNSAWNISSMVIPSATELKQKGLKFKPKSNPKHMLDISFEYGALKIPRLIFDDSTELIFANLLAFEHSKYGKENIPFTSFVAFLDNLVNTPNDVTILQECGIVENWPGSEEELAHFINQVTKGTSFTSDHYLMELVSEVKRYIESHRMKSSWKRQREKLFRDYFSSPWKVISLFAAFILLVLTSIQTFYAVYAYKYPPSS
ncbi:UPF0481 protein At3g47200-like [Carex rostrata]